MKTSPVIVKYEQEDTNNIFLMWLYLARILLWDGIPSFSVLLTDVPFYEKVNTYFFIYFFLCFSVFLQFFCPDKELAISAGH